MEPSIKNDNVTSGDAGQSDLLTKSQVQGLSDHLFSVMHTSDQGDVRKIGSSDPRRAYFSKAKIDALFNANPGSDGLYVYFGAHNSHIPHHSGKKSYENKLTASLVTAKGTDLNLQDEKNAFSTTGAGLALASGKLCPPDICP